MATFPNLRTYVEYETPKPLFGPLCDAPVGRDGKKDFLPACPQAYVDTPQVRHTDWVRACGGPMKPLGQLPKELRVGIIGAGSAGVTTAFRAVMAGANVTLIEARHEVGGRARSVKMGAQNVAEEGCMRFPPSEGDLYDLSEAFGYVYTDNFPNPSLVPTLVIYEGESIFWDDHTKIPPGFKTVYTGWNKFVDQGCKIDDKTFVSPTQMGEWLKSPDINIRMNVQNAWQDYINEFKYDNFRNGLEKIFGNTNKAPPAGKNWTLDDFNRFGKVGIGSGGFSAFFHHGFLTMIRSIPNHWDTKQARFNRLVDGKPVAVGIRELWQSIWEHATKLGLKTLLNTKATAVSKRTGLDGNLIYTVTVKTADGLTDYEFDELFINLTTSVANMDLKLARDGPGQLFDNATCDAIKTVHMARTTKLFVQVPRCGLFEDPKFPRVLLTDGDLPQAYCLDYGDEKTLVVLLVYAWEDYSKNLEKYKDPKALFEHLKMLAASAVANSQNSPNWANCLEPADDIQFIHWQDDPTARGAFTSALPGQDRHCATLFYDFEKKEGPYLIGDSFSFGGGWVESGLETALNCFSKMLDKHGELNNPKLAPVNLISSSTYTY